MEERPAAFLETFEQSGIAKEFQMAGDAGLTLSQNPRQFTDGQVTMGAQGQDTKAVRLSGRTQECKDLVHGGTGDLSYSG